MGKLDELIDRWGKTYQKHAIICRDQEKGSVMYIILKGQVRIFKVGPPPRFKVNTLVTLGAGDFFGEMAILEGEPRYANAQALTDVTVLELDLEGLKQIISIQPDFGIALMKKLSGRIRQLNNKLIFEEREKK